MAIADYATFKSKAASPRQPLSALKALQIQALNAPFRSSWTNTPKAGVAPSTAAVPTNATAGAFGQLDSSGTQRLLRQVLSGGPIGGVGSIEAKTLVLIDRLSHQGGLSGTVTTPQSTNLPTAALTRHTDGVGVFAALEIYTAIGVTATTVSVSYTNSAGTAGRTAPDMVLGGVTYDEIRDFLWVPLAAGDVGVKSVESLTIAATTGTVGNFGVTLFRPLLMLPVYDACVERTFDGLLDLYGMMPVIDNGACLQWLAMSSGSTATTLQISTLLSIAED